MYIAYDWCEFAVIMSLALPEADEGDSPILCQKIIRSRGQLGSMLGVTWGGRRAPLCWKEALGSGEAADLCWFRYQALCSTCASTGALLVVVPAGYIMISLYGETGPRVCQLAPDGWTSVHFMLFTLVGEMVQDQVASEFLIAHAADSSLLTNRERAPSRPNLRMLPRRPGPRAH